MDITLLFGYLLVILIVSIRNSDLVCLQNSTLFVLSLLKTCKSRPFTDWVREIALEVLSTTPSIIKGV